MTTLIHDPARRGLSFLLGMLAFAALAIALRFGQPVTETIADRLQSRPTEAEGKAALTGIIQQVRATRPAGRPTWLTGTDADGGCVLPAKALEPPDWAVLDLIEHGGDYAQLYAVCTVRQATLVRARFKWPDGEVEFVVTDMEASHGR